MSHMRTFGLLLLMGASSSHSFDFNYHSIQLDYLNSETQDVTAQGYQLKSTQKLNDTMTYSLGLKDVSTETGNKTTSYSLGLGYHMPITALTDMVMGINVSRVQTNASNEDTGRAIEFGLRQQLSAKTEFDFNVVSTYEFGQADTGFIMGLRSNVGDDVSVRGGYQKNEHGDVFTVGLRLEL